MVISSAGVASSGRGTRRLGGASDRGGSGSGGRVGGVGADMELRLPVEGTVVNRDRPNQEGTVFDDPSGVRAMIPGMGICEGRVVIITGSGRGIGRAHALEFARLGA
jgi:hypothetical protein